MTPEQRDELRSQVARAVMGWSAKAIPWAYSGEATLWHSAEGIPLLTCHAWRPDENEPQCTQILDRMLALGFRCTLELDAQQCTVTFVNDRPASGTATHADRRIAVMQAALAALPAGQ